MSRDFSLQSTGDDKVVCSTRFQCSRLGLDITRLSTIFFFALYLQELRRPDVERYSDLKIIQARKRLGSTYECVSYLSCHLFTSVQVIYLRNLGHICILPRLKL